jgi:hypothetical protein
MAVEIRELVIRAVVTGDKETPDPMPCVALTVEDRATIIDTAVKEVLRILKASKER